MTKKTEKLVIVGSGPAAFTAALYAARAELQPLVLEGSLQNSRNEIPGGQLMTTTEVENFPGFPEGISGHEIVDLFRKQAQRFGTRSEMHDVVKVDFGGHPFRLWTSEGDEIDALAVIVATGARAKRLRPQGADDYWQKGISACAVCDGALPLFRNKPLAVVGGGDTAMEEASFLTKYASRVYVIHRRDEFRASAIMQARVLDDPKVEVLWNTTVKSVSGDGSLLKTLVVESTAGEPDRTLEVEGLFFAIGHVPNTDFLGGQVETNETGYIVLKQGQETSVHGVFAAGDVHDFRYRQAITAAGAGCAAALDAEHYLSGLRHEKPELFDDAAR